MEDSNRNRDIDRGKGVPCEVADVVTDEFTPITICSFRPFNIRFVSVESDIGRTGQIRQQRSGPAPDIQHPVAGSGLDDLLRESAQPPSCADQMMERLINKRVREWRPETTTFAHELLALLSNVCGNRDGAVSFF